MSDMRMANIDKLTLEIEKLLADAEVTGALPQVEDRDASWEVRISDDGLTAYLDMYPAVGNGVSPDPLGICTELEEMGIRRVDRDRVMALVTLCDSGYPASGEDAVVARGVPPESPSPGRIEFLVLMERAKRSEDDEASVDWKNLWLTPSVHEGDVIAKIYPPKEGTDGVDVYGNPLPAASHTFFRIRYGDGVNVSEGEDGTVEIASARTVGQPVFRDNVLDVAPLLVINGDVNISTGSIDFTGSVLVSGSVLEGFSVKAERDVNVQGWVYNARVQAGGSCSVKGGVTGERSLLLAGEDVRVGVVEYAEISASRKVEVFGYALFAMLEAGESIYVQGRNRRGVVGGTCIAGACIEALSAGSPMESSTQLEAGRDPFQARILQELDRKKEALLAMQKKIEQAILSIKGTGPNFDIDTLTEEEKGKLFLLVQYHGKMKSSVAELAARIDDEKRASIAEKRIMPRIRIRDRVYPNVTLKIWGQTLVVKQQEFHVSFFMDKDRGVIARGGF
ncbi:MAG TPA: FapA family protein [Synergistales bacterium]|nr:FapA family protein [Synergistales bacterium]